MENLATFNVTPSVYEHALTPTWERTDSYHGTMTEVPYFDATVRKVKGKVISVRTSDSDFQSYSSSVSHAAYLSPEGTGSFSAMHRDISSGLMQELRFTAQTYGSKPGGKPTGDKPIGETNPDLPVGDVLLPMLLMAGVYAVVRFFKNRKMSKQVNLQNS